MEERKSFAGTDSREVADSLVALGLLRLDQAKVDEAEKLVREGLAMNKRHLADRDPAVTRAMFAVGRVVEERGGYEEAIKILEEAVRIQSQGEATPALSDSMNALAMAHQSKGPFCRG